MYLCSYFKDVLRNWRLLTYFEWHLTQFKDIEFYVFNLVWVLYNLFILKVLCTFNYLNILIHTQIKCLYFLIYLWYLQVFLIENLGYNYNYL